ncbi:aromatic amino acid transaminase [Pseudogemmobacter sonorensis]|uniref:amino acid aminotransferase n=1 Tax=Pseudogemmobacter sonorensis TaxID=2989681 RepID=UPI0036B3B4E3
MFERYQSPPPDVIVELMQAYRADPRPGKIDLGIGVYKNDQGQTPVMRAVKQAEQCYIGIEASKAYLGLGGDGQFVDLIADLVLGEAAKSGNLAGIQTVGGGAAVRLLADMLARNDGMGEIWIPSPTWINHLPIARAAGLKVREYNYYDPDTGTVAFERMIADLSAAKAGDVVLLHGCCHNPTGADLSPQQWADLGALILSRGLLPFVDMAYQGFGDGLEADAAGIRKLATMVPEMVISVSCSKNFGVYRDRAGAALILSENAEGTAKAKAVLLAAGRVNYSFPPNHAAASIALLLSDPALTDDWKAELDEMRVRLQNNRRILAEALRAATNSDRFDCITGHKGMFSLLGLGLDRVLRLREEAAIFMPPDGRMNIAAINVGQLDVIAGGIAAVLR